MSSWFNTKKSTSPSDSIEVSVVKGFLEDTPSLRYWMKSVEMEAVSASITAPSVIRAIHNGHSDIELLVFINPQTKELFVDPATGQNRTRYTFNGKTQSWMLDLDEVPGVDSIAKLRTVMISRKVPVPYFITQTGPNSFHCFYHGHFGQWPKRKIHWLISRWANVSLSMPKAGPEKEEWERIVHASGICIHHLRQHYGSHHMRVPGSINTNHKNEDGTFWRCIGWRNPVYYDMHAEYVADVGMEPQEKIIIETAIPISEQAAPEPKQEPCKILPISTHVNFERFVEPISDLIEEIFPQGFVSVKTDKLIQMIANNALGLAWGTCRIHQETWAKELGVTQFDVSRMLKRFIELGVLEKISDSYAIGGYSKTYGAGPLLRPAIGQYGKPLPPPKWDRWEAGNANARMLVDVRYFCSLGLSDEEIIHCLHRRQAHRPVKKQRTVRDFLCAIGHYREYVMKFGKWAKPWMPDHQEAKIA